MTDAEVIDYVHNLLVERCGENPAHDYMVQLRDIRDNLGFQTDNQVDVFTEKWKKLFPAPSVLSEHGVGDKTLIEHDKIQKKMRAFFKEFTKKTQIRCKFDEKCKMITEATEWYINKFTSGKSEWRFIMHADNFINHAQKGSELARIIVSLKEREATKKDGKVIDLNFRFS